MAQIIVQVPRGWLRPEQLVCKASLMKEAKGKLGEDMCRPDQRSGKGILSRVTLIRAVSGGWGTTGTLVD